MSLWLIRAGRHGEFESKFLEENRVYVTWNDLALNLLKHASRESLMKGLVELYKESKLNTVRNWARQLWLFAHAMQPGDWIILPSKTQQAIYIGEIAGDYHFEPNLDYSRRQKRGLSLARIETSMQATKPCQTSPAPN